MEREWLETVRRRLQLVLAFTRSVEPRSLPSRRALWADAALAAFVLILRLHNRGGGGPLGADHLAILNGGGGGFGLVLASAPLAARRRYPLTALFVLLVGVLATRYDAKPVAVATVAFAGYSAVKYSRFRGAALMTVPWLWVLAGSVLWGITALLVLVSIALTVTVAYAVYASGERERMLAEHEVATRLALDRERARIASELHDVVTHSVSVMIVQAGAARQVLDESPEEARAALLAVEASGRAAMTELRHLLGLLSPEPAGERSGATEAEAAELEPQPGLAQLPTLVDRLTMAGLPIELDLGELPEEIAPGLDLAVFRVIQEALSNVLRHAGKPSTRVSLTSGDGQLVVEVADTGRPMPAVAPPVPAGAGRGLAGLRERIALYSGVLDAGPRSGGGWFVRARFPLDAPSRREVRAPGTSGGLAAATGRYAGEH